MNTRSSGNYASFFYLSVKIPALLLIYLTQWNGLYSMPFISNITTVGDKGHKGPAGGMQVESQLLTLQW